MFVLALLNSTVYVALEGSRVLRLEALSCSRFCDFSNNLTYACIKDEVYVDIVTGFY